jgi:folate-dependent phosphoribosylglycinamide formyltransferase PurN
MYKIDLILSLITDILLKGSFISTSKHGVVSSHGGLLPKYRGVDCLKWAVLNREQEVGMSMQSINTGVDTGGIISTHSVSLSNKNTYTVESLNKEIFYRYKLFSFLNVVEQLSDKGRILIKAQENLDGKQYFSMHQDLSEIVDTILKLK